MLREITLEKINTSVLSNGTICPVCEHIDQDQAFRYESEGLQENIECDQCGSCWTTYMSHSAIYSIRLPNGSMADLPSGQIFSQRIDPDDPDDRTKHFKSATTNIRTILEYFKNPTLASSKEVARAVASLNLIMPDVK